MNEESSSEKILLQSKLPTSIPCSKPWADSLKYDDQSSSFVDVPQPTSMLSASLLLPSTLDEVMGIDATASLLYGWVVAAL